MLWQQQLSELASGLKRKSAEFLTVRPLLKFFKLNRQIDGDTLPKTISVSAITAKTTVPQRFQTPDPSRARLLDSNKLDHTTL